MIRVRDLHNQIGTNGPHPFLLCCFCGRQYSANAGDYLLENPKTVFRCCGHTMVLALSETVYTIVDK